VNREKEGLLKRFAERKGLWILFCLFPFGGGSMYYEIRHWDKKKMIKLSEIRPKFFLKKHGFKV